MGSHDPGLPSVTFLDLDQLDQNFRSLEVFRRIRAEAALNEKHRALGGAPGGAASGLLAGGRGGYFRVHRNGILYWHPRIGAFWVVGPILGKYLELGGPGGFLGYPTTDGRGCPDGVGGFNHFENGSIYWSPETGAREVHGEIRNKWAALGWETFLGYPVTDELGTPDGMGRFSHFRPLGTTGDQDASIYWTPGTGAHEVHGAIRQHWASLGWEAGALGYPLSDEEGSATRRVSRFQGGHIRFQADHPIRIVGFQREGPAHRRITWLSDQRFESYNIRWMTFYPPAPYSQPSGDLGDPGGRGGWLGEQEEHGGGTWGSYLWKIPLPYPQYLLLQGCDFDGVFAGSSCTSWVVI